MRPRLRGGPVSVADEVQSYLLDLGLTDYAETYELQQQLVERRRAGQLDRDLFLLTEHTPVFTLGRRGGRQNLMVSENFLEEKNIPLVHIERGGDITYHAPGQLVLYPVFHLRRGGLSVGDYVELLEEVMLQLASRHGVTAVRDGRNHGVWVGGKKLGSVGIAIRHGVSFHGLALNISVALEPFSWVNPCGLAGVTMTSLSVETGGTVKLEEVKADVPDVLSRVFHSEVKKVVEAPLRDTV